MSEKVALVGSGLIGQAWAIVFARAGREVRLYDSKPGAVETAIERIGARLRDLERMELIDSAESVLRRVAKVRSLEAALEAASYVQESVPEDSALKHQVFAALDRLAPATTILASSSSGIPGSRFLDLPGRHRCLVAHPANPPYLLPLVELVPTPWTAEETVKRAWDVMVAVGQVPIRLKAEIEGFVMNRLQIAVINEAMSLVARGIADPEDIDKMMANSLGLRWSFMGPFETMDLNAPKGFLDYATRYANTFREVGADLKVTERWTEAAIKTVEAARRRILPAERVLERHGWRDRRLMALARHKAQAAKDIGP